VSEAEDRYLAKVSEDCEAVLGPGVELLDFEFEEHGDAVRLVARYRLDDEVWESAATGQTVVAAHAALRARLLFDRIRLGFTALVEPAARR
jgi:hypothetical protein